MIGDLLPTGFTDPAALSSLSAAGMSDLKTMFGTPTPITTTTTLSSPSDPGPTPYAYCQIEDGIFFWNFMVAGHGWVTDHGDKLRHEENGCGALTGWQWHDDRGDGNYRAIFSLPYLMKEGCVERAIVSAGGPKISCREAPDFAAADGVPGSGSSPRYSDEQIQSFASVYAPNTTYRPYIPMDWATVVSTPSGTGLR